MEVVAAVANQIEPRMVGRGERASLLVTLGEGSSNGPADFGGRQLLIRMLGSRYRVFPFLTDLADYGVPQRRVRSFLTFIQRDEPSLELLDRVGAVPYPRPPTPAGAPDPMTLREALASLDAKPLDAISPAQARGRVQPYARRARLGQQSPVSDGRRHTTRLRWPSLAELAVRALRRRRSGVRGRGMSDLRRATAAPRSPRGATAPTGS